MKWIQIGSVGVDSGRLVICDPSYIDDEWIEGTDAPGHPEYVLTEKGKRKFPGLHGFRKRCFRDFQTYEDIIQEIGMTMNAARVEGLVERVERKPTGEFSYEGCCLGTSHEAGNEGYGQLKYERGHDGVAVVFNSGYGDGYYPVYARIEDGRVAEVRIVMMGDEFPRIEDGKIVMPRVTMEKKDN